MTFANFIFALVAFLVTAAFAIFAVLIVSIRRGQRTPFLSNPAERQAGTIARHALIRIRYSEDDQ